MRAVDTNVLARFYLRDDGAQGHIAPACFRVATCSFPRPSSWSSKGCCVTRPSNPEGKVLECVEHLIALPGITVEDRDEIEAALSHCRKGIAFADALHLAASKACSELLTFYDRGYARRARKLRLKPPVLVPTR